VARPTESSRGGASSQHDPLADTSRLRVAALRLAQASLQSGKASRDRSPAPSDELLSLLHVTLESTPDAVVAIGVDGNTLLWNSRYVKLWRVPLALFEQAAKNAVAEHIATQMADPAHYMATTSEVIANPTLARTDVFELIDGRVVERRIAPARVRNTALGFLICWRDITEQRRAEAEMQATQERLAALTATLEQRVHERTEALEDANRELAAFSYTVSHDLRSPLRGIDAWSVALLEDHEQQLDEQALMYLTRIRGETQRMAELIDDLMQLAQLSQSTLRIEPVDLSDLAARVVAGLRERSPARNARVLIAPGLRVTGDPGLLRVLLTNLLDNAWKFTSRCDPAVIECGCTRQDEHVVYYVRDNGAGFDMSHATRLFTPFQRAHRASDYPGTGVGLATVERIVRRHGGRCWAQAAPNEGATIFFTLPAPQQP